MSAFGGTNDFQKWAGSTADFGLGSDRGYARKSPKDDVRAKAVRPQIFDPTRSTVLRHKLTSPGRSLLFTRDATDLAFGPEPAFTLTNDCRVATSRTAVRSRSR